MATVCTDMKVLSALNCTLEYSDNGQFCIYVYFAVMSTCDPMVQASRYIKQQIIQLW